MNDLDIDFKTVEQPLKVSNIVDEFVVEEQIPLPYSASVSVVEDIRPINNIIKLTDNLISEKVELERTKMLQTTDYSDKAKEISKASLDTSMETQSLNVEQSKIDNAITKHKIEIQKHKLDIAAKHEFKKIDYEKKVERQISNRKEKSKNKASKLEKYETIKMECNIKTNNLIVLSIISFLISVGDFFKGLSYTFKSFNGFLKSIIIIAIIIVGFISLWYGLNLSKYIRIGGV